MTQGFGRKKATDVKFKNESCSAVFNSFVTLWDIQSMDPPGQNTRVGSLSPGGLSNQESNPGLHVTGRFFTSLRAHYTLKCKYLIEVGWASLSSVESSE